MPQVFCVLDEGGRTLLTKTRGDIQTPSFPSIGLLCSISTFSSSSGYSIQSFGTQNVQIVYRRFSNHLMFVLATSNLLVQPDALQVLLQTVYDGVQMLLGSACLALDSAARIDTLRKKLKGFTLIDSLLADDALVPCLMLPAPQLLGLPMQDRSSLHSTLATVAASAGSELAALVSEGLYLAATRDWWRLKPREALLLQQLAAHAEPEANLVDMSVYVSVRGRETQMRLLATKLEQGVQLLLLCGNDVDPQLLQPTIERHMARITHIYSVPLWCTGPVPQLAPLGFDLAAVVQLPHPTPAPSPSPPPPSTITLFWGRSNMTPQGFNPLMSPTLRKQMQGGGSTGGGVSPSHHGASAGSFRALSFTRAGTGTDAGLGPDNLQLFFKSCCDLLVAFMLQCTGQGAGGEANGGAAGNGGGTGGNFGGIGGMGTPQAARNASGAAAGHDGAADAGAAGAEAGSDAAAATGGASSHASGPLCHAFTAQSGSLYGSAASQAAAQADTAAWQQGAGGAGAAAPAAAPPRRPARGFFSPAAPRPAHHHQPHLLHTPGPAGSSVPQSSSSLMSPSRMAQRMFHSFLAASRSASASASSASQQQPATQLEELHVCTGGYRLVALMDRTPPSAGRQQQPQQHVFLCLSSKATRAQAAEAARKLRSVYNMAYQAEVD